MFDFPTSFPPDAFGVRIVENPDGWSVEIFRSVHLMLLAASGVPLVPELEFIVVAKYSSLIRAIHYCQGSRAREAWLKQWGG